MQVEWMCVRLAAAAGEASKQFHAVGYKGTLQAVVMKSKEDTSIWAEQSDIWRYDYKRFNVLQLTR